MKIFDFEKGSKAPTVIALGFFDCIHLGHKALILKAQDIAKSKGCEEAVFTFQNDINEVISTTSGVILTYEDRLKKLEKLSVKSVISCFFTKELAGVLAKDFFNLLAKRFLVKAIVCGKDYRFGFKGEGNVELLKTLCKKNGIELYAIDDVEIDGERVSSTKIKSLLIDGNVSKANLLLGDSYFLTGTVSHGREVGRKMGFPTANVIIPSEKVKIKNGVYKTHVEIDGKAYKCITNYGGRPTFDLDEVLTETYIYGFDGDLYGREITIYFDEYLRDLVKFECVEQLTSQLQKDLEEIK